MERYDDLKFWGLFCEFSEARDLSLELVSNSRGLTTKFGTAG
jgi:hypothetical protein